MSRWILPPVAGLIEPALAPQFTVDGIGAIQRLNDHEILVSMVERQLAIDSAVQTEQLLLNVKLRGRTENLPVIMHQLWPCLFPEGVTPPLVPSGLGPQLVRK